MRCFGCFLLLFILCSCGMKSATDRVVDSAITTLDALEHSVPVECKTKAINEQFLAVKANIESIKATCDAEKKIIEQSNIKWKVAFFSLIIIIAVWVLRKVAL